MRPFFHFIILVTLTLFLSGCVSSGTRSVHDTGMFAPVSVRLHPVFSKISDWSGDGKPDGIEALVELRDQFGDPCKARGQFVFELFEYQAQAPDPRGKRLVNPWIGSIKTVDEQRQRWNFASRCYLFRLELDRIKESSSYVMSVSFEPVGGSRLFDQFVIGKR